MADPVPPAVPKPLADWLKAQTGTIIKGLIVAAIAALSAWLTSCGVSVPPIVVQSAPVTVELHDASGNVSALKVR